MWSWRLSWLHLFQAGSYLYGTFLGLTPALRHKVIAMVQSHEAILEFVADRHQLNESNGALVCLIRKLVCVHQ